MRPFRLSTENRWTQPGGEEHQIPYSGADKFFAQFMDIPLLEKNNICEKKKIHEIKVANMEKITIKNET